MQLISCCLSSWIWGASKSLRASGRSALLIISSLVRPQARYQVCRFFLPTWDLIRSVRQNDVWSVRLRHYCEVLSVNATFLLHKKFRQLMGHRLLRFVSQGAVMRTNALDWLQHLHCLVAIECSIKPGLAYMRSRLSFKVLHKLLIWLWLSRIRFLLLYWLHSFAFLFSLELSDVLAAFRQDEFLVWAWSCAALLQWLG